MRWDRILTTGSEQCCANTALERSCAKTNSNRSCSTNSGSNLNLNNRLHDALRLMVNNNEIECSILGPRTGTKTNNYGNSNFNNSQITPPYPTIMKLNIFFQGQAKRVTKTSTEITKQLQKEFKDVLTGIVCFDVMSPMQVKPDSKSYQVPWWHIAYVLQKPFKEELERL